MSNLTEKILKFQSVESEFALIKKSGKASELQNLISSIFSKTQVNKDNLKVIISHLIDEVYEESFKKASTPIQEPFSPTLKLHQNSTTLSNREKKNEKLKTSHSQQIISKNKKNTSKKEEICNSLEGNFQIEESKTLRKSEISYQSDEPKNNSIMSVQFSTPNNKNLIQGKKIF